ncbi:uncharacterized protein [Atheta coriaria]|uniref:uncharacterized protein n=1 Tax=Dalotia coriaria TaxID=877792 RepID=UPI0031F36F57
MVELQFAKWVPPPAWVPYRPGVPYRPLGVGVQLPAPVTVVQPAVPIGIAPVHAAVPGIPLDGRPPVVMDTSNRIVVENNHFGNTPKVHLLSYQWRNPNGDECVCKKRPGSGPTPRMVYCD